MISAVPAIILITIGVIVVLCVIAFAVMTLLALLRRKDDTNFLKKAEERSNQHADDTQ